VQLDALFIPPVAAISASPRLATGIRRILNALTARHASLLAQRVRPTTAEFAGADALRYWMLSVVGSFVPRISDLLDRRSAHPHDAYRVLVELQGALAAFTPAGTNDAVKFDYLDMTSTFDPLFATILQILDTLGQQQYREIPTRRHDDRVVYAELREPAIFRNEFFLGVIGADADAVRQNVPRLVKMATWDEVPNVIGSAVGGVPLKHEYRAPSVLPMRAGMHYFRLDKASPAWASIVRKGTLGIYHPPDLGTLEITLSAVDPSLV
jgi:type VI secretion system protein ImpJ